MTIDVTTHTTSESKVYITAESLGKVFADMDSLEQAEFFLGVSSATEKWSLSVSFQWVGLREKLEDLPDALEAFQGLSEFGKG